MPASPPPTLLRVADGRLLISHARLQKVYQYMPTLEYLLEGHPDMDVSNKKVDRSTGMREIELHKDFEVTRDEMLTLLEFFSEANRTPDSEEGWKNLHSVSLRLGGSDLLDKTFAQRTTVRPHSLPTSPNEDRHQQWEWYHLPCFNGLPPQSRVTDDLQQRGFVYADLISFNNDTGTFPFGIHFRKRKREAI